jgi:hypothetical protein
MHNTLETKHIKIHIKKPELFKGFLQTNPPPPPQEILAVSEHGLKDDIIECILEGYTVVSHFRRKEHKGGGIAIYSSKNTLQYKPLEWITETSIQKEL